jgi:hypothetical protein
MDAYQPYPRSIGLMQEVSRAGEDFGLLVVVIRIDLAAARH